MPSATDRSSRFTRFTTEELEDTVASVAALPLSPFEQSLLADLRAEIARRHGEGEAARAEVNHAGDTP